MKGSDVHWTPFIETAREMIPSRRVKLQKIGKFVQTHFIKKLDLIYNYNPSIFIQ
jgi:hypothetical protein